VGTNPGLGSGAEFLGQVGMEFGRFAKSGFGFMRRAGLVFEQMPKVVPSGGMLRVDLEGGAVCGFGQTPECRSAQNSVVV
jgi:hypothetical protein